MYCGLLFNNLISCKVYGTAYIDVGYVLNLRVVNTDATLIEKTAAPEMSGRFLVKDLVHVFTPNGYHQALTLCRTGSEFEFVPSGFGPDNEPPEAGD